MKLSLISLSILSLASAKTVTLSVESDDCQFQDNGISNIHFGAGINGALLSDSLVKYQLNDTNGEIYKPINTNSGQIPFSARVLGNGLIFGVSGGDPVVLKDNFLTVNGSDSVFYACKTLEWDPYRYTADPNTYGVGVYAEKAPSGCDPIKIQGIVSE